METKRGKYFYLLFQHINFISFIVCKKLVTKDEKYHEELVAVAACAIQAAEGTTQVKEA